DVVRKVRLTSRHGSGAGVSFVDLASQSHLDTCRPEFDPLYGGYHSDCGLLIHCLAHPLVSLQSHAPSRARARNSVCKKVGCDNFAFPAREVVLETLLNTPNEFRTPLPDLRQEGQASNRGYLDARFEHACGNTVEVVRYDGQSELTSSARDSPSM